MLLIAVQEYIIRIPHLNYVSGGVVHDYAGCQWPEGYMDKDHCYVFNHEDIDCLYYIGMQDVEEFNYRFELDEKLKEMK